MEAALSEPFFTRTMKVFSRPDGFMFFGKLGVEFFSIYDFLYPFFEKGVRLIRARPKFFLISDKPSVSLGFVDCSFYTRRIALKNDYHKKRMDAPSDFNYLKTLARTFIVPP